MGRLNAAVLDADEQNCRELCALLEQANFPVAPLYSLEDLSEHLKKEQVGVLIIDLDTLPVHAGQRHVSRPGGEGGTFSL